MYRDTEEELERLQRELLDADEPEEEIPEDAPENPEEEVDLEDIIKEFGSGEQPEPYRNFSNDYGREEPAEPEDLSETRIFRNDPADLPVEEFSQELQDLPEEEDSGLRGLVLTASLLAAAVAAVLLFWMFRYFL